MAGSDDARPPLDELIAALRAIQEGQETLARELGLLRQELRSLRQALAGTTVAAPSPAAAPAPAPLAPVGGTPADREPAGPDTGPVATPSLPGAPPDAVGPRPRRPRFPDAATALRLRVHPGLARLRAAVAAPGSLLERGWVLALLIGLLVTGASELNLLQPVEVLAEYPKEWVRADRGRREVVQQIVVVAIDEDSLQRLGPFGAAWRAHHGVLLRRLADDGARAVGFDLYFKTPNERFDPPFLEGIAHARDKGTGVVVGMDYDSRRHRLLPPVSPVREAITRFASTYLEKDRVTNLVRFVSLFQPSGDAEGMATSLVPAFSLGVALAGGRQLEDFPRYRETLAIDFAGRTEAFRVVPYADVAAGRFEPGTFRDRFVLVGAFYAASRDFFDTPVESEMPGVVIHANALYTLLRGVARPLGGGGKAAVILIVALTTSAICARLRRVPRAALVIALVGAHWTLAIGLGLAANAIYLEVIPATVAVAFTWSAVALREKVVAMRELRRTLGLPEEAVRRLERDPEFQRGSLGKRVTVLASDVKDYSAFSRAHPPVHVREIMTEYQQMFERAIYRHGGYVNKFIGDAVIAIFGYPMREDETALRCLRAAREAQEGLQALTEKWRREGRPGIAATRIGVNTGTVSISYLGSSKKQLDVMGANVDLAARLESAAGEFGCLALLGPETYAEVRDKIRSRTVPVKLKNRPDVPQAYTLDGFLGDPISVPVAAGR